MVEVNVLYDQIRQELRDQDLDFMLYLEAAQQLARSLEAVRSIEGAFIEVGVYAGGSAKLICELKDDARLLYLMDTFEGSPLSEVGDATSQGDFRVARGWVEDYLKDYPNVRIIQGLFPFCAEELMAETFAFVHLDVDTYRSTYDGLSFFWPRLAEGGRILVHDYHCPGPKRAVDEFFNRGHYAELVKWTS